jgi:hypothetical protein
MGGKSDQVDAALAVAGWSGLVWWMLQGPILGYTPTQWGLFAGVPSLLFAGSVALYAMSLPLSNRHPAAAWAKSPHQRSPRGHQRAPSQQRAFSGQCIRVLALQFTPR